MTVGLMEYLRIDTRRTDNIVVEVTDGWEQAFGLDNALFSSVTEAPD